MTEQQQDERPDEALEDLEADRTTADEIAGGKVATGKPNPGNIPFVHYSDKSSP